MKMIKTVILKKLQTNPFIGIVTFEKCMVNNCLLMAQSFGDYVNNQPIETSRAVKYILMNGFMVLNIIKYAIEVWCDEPWLLAEFGEFLNIFYPKMRVFALNIVLILIDLLGYQVTFFYAEWRRKFIILEIFHSMITKDRVWRAMDKCLAKKLMTNSYVLSKVLIEFQIKGITMVGTVVLPMMAYQAYMSDVPHSPYRLVISCFATLLFLRQCFVLSMSTPFIFVLSILYMKFTFIQILKNIDRYVKDSRHCRMALSEHQRICTLVSQFSPFINNIIGFVYNVMPFIVIITLRMIMVNELALWKRCYLFNILIVALTAGFFINKLVTWFPLNHRKIPKMIYPICSGKQSRPIGQLLTLDEFLSSLHKKFLGFYCFNMFKMSKLSFYKYVFGLTITYMVLVKTINEM